MASVTPAADDAALAPPEQTLQAAGKAFARAAETSERQALLGVLTDDAWVLAPGPVPARAYYDSHSEGAGTLAWYPAVAVVAASADLGFTSGPYTHVREDAHSGGHLLTVWRRVEGRWRVAFNGGVTHGRLPTEPPAADPAQPGAMAHPVGQPGDLATAFEAVAGREGLGAALRTYARNQGFLLLLEGQPPMALAAAERHLRTRIVKGAWREATQGISDDTTLHYVVGTLVAGAYAQVWQYDTRTANWGLRVLLLTQP